MKTSFLILAIISGLLLYGYQGAKQEVSDLRIENTELADSLDAKTQQLKKRDKEYESLSTNYATLKKELDKATRVSTPAPVTIPTPEEPQANAPAPAPVTEGTPEVDPTVLVETRLRDLKGIYDRAKGELDRKKDILETNLRNAKIAYEQVQRDTPEFQEQGVRRDAFGNSKGSKGVRTSDADRARAMEARDAELVRWENYIRVAKEAQVSLTNDYKALEENYRKATAEAKN